MSALGTEDFSEGAKHSETPTYNYLHELTNHPFLEKYLRNTSSERDFNIVRKKYDEMNNLKFAPLPMKYNDALEIRLIDNKHTVSNNTIPKNQINHFPKSNVSTDNSRQINSRTNQNTTEQSSLSHNNHDANIFQWQPVNKGLRPTISNIDHCIPNSGNRFQALQDTPTDSSETDSCSGSSEEGDNITEQQIQRSIKHVLDRRQEMKASKTRTVACKKCDDIECTDKTHKNGINVLQHPPNGHCRAGQPGFLSAKTQLRLRVVGVTDV